MNKRAVYLMLGVVLALVLVSGYYLSSYFSKPKYDIRKISGYVVSIEGEIITTKGLYESEETLPKELSEERDITFKVNSSTIFKKVEINIPSKEELIASGKAKVLPNGTYRAEYTLDDQSRIEGSGSLDNIKIWLSKGGVSIKAEFPESIHNSKDPIASEVSYLILIEPVRK